MNGSFRQPEHSPVRVTTFLPHFARSAQCRSFQQRDRLTQGEVQLKQRLGGFEASGSPNKVRAPHDLDRVWKDCSISFQVQVQYEASTALPFLYLVLILSKSALGAFMPAGLNEECCRFRFTLEVPDSSLSRDTMMKNPKTSGWFRLLTPTHLEGHFGPYGRGGLKSPHYRHCSGSWG